MADHDQHRNNHGRFDRTLDSAERDAECVRLRSRGWTFQQISDELEYGSRSNAHKAFKRALAEVPVEAVNDYRAGQLELLASLKREALGVLEREHVTISFGKVIKNEDGRPLLDDGPRLAAINTLEKLIAREATLTGTPMPARAQIDLGGEGDRERELVELIARLKRERADAGPGGDGEPDGS